MKRSKFVTLVLVCIMSVSGLQPIFAQAAEQPNNEVSESNSDSNASTIDKVTAGVAVVAGVAILLKALTGSTVSEEPKTEEKSSWWSW